MSKKTNEKMKSMSQLIKDAGKTCKALGCDKPLTHFEGVGADTLCRDHQLIEIELTLNSR